jgi:hypothetical protein
MDGDDYEDAFMGAAINQAALDQVSLTAHKLKCLPIPGAEVIAQYVLGLATVQDVVKAVKAEADLAARDAALDKAFNERRLVQALFEHDGVGLHVLTFLRTHPGGAPHGELVTFWGSSPLPGLYITVDELISLGMAEVSDLGVRCTVDGLELLRQIEDKSEISLAPDKSLE